MADTIRTCIVLLENTWPKRGGTSELLYNFAFGLAELGFEVHFASFINRYQKEPLPIFRQHFYHDYARGECPSKSTLGITALRRLGQAANVNANVLRVNFDISFRRFLRSVLRTHGVEVVLIGTCWPAPATVAAASSMGIPTVQYLNAVESDSLHGLSLPNRLLAHWTEGVGISASFKTTVVSEEDKKILLRRGFAEEGLVLIPNCVDYRKYELVTGDQVLEVRRRLGARDRPIIVFVGGLDYPPNRLAVRRIYETIAPAVLREIPDAIFLVIGPNPPEEYVHPSIIYTGGLYDQELAAHILAADIGIAPIELGTGTRLKVLEYFAAGKPVVSTTIGALGLEAKHGKNIMIADQYSKFSEHVTSILNSPPLGKELGEEAKVVAKEKYSREVLAEKLALVLEEAVSHSRRIASRSGTHA